MIAFYRDKKDENGKSINGVIMFSNLDTDNNNKVTLKEFLVDLTSIQNKEKFTFSKGKTKARKPKYKKANLTQNLKNRLSDSKRKKKTKSPSSKTLNIKKNENKTVAVAKEKVNVKKADSEKESIKKNQNTTVLVRKGKTKINEKKSNLKKANTKKNNKKKNVSPRKKRKDKFRIIDFNDDDVISLNEMVNFYKNKKNKSGELFESEVIFYGLDKNKDKKLTFNEFYSKIDWRLGKQTLKLIKNSKN